MKIIPRPHSVVTGKEDLVLLASLPDFPVFIGATTSPEDHDLKSDMCWYICPHSGIIQLDPLLPNEIVYSEYHSEAIGGVWLSHHQAFVDFCLKYPSKNVLEIGGSNGFIAKKYTQLAKCTQWTIVEPTPNLSSTDKIEVIEGFFDATFVTDKYDTIVHSHVLEHTFDPNTFLADLSCSLSEGKKHIFSVPNLYRYMQEKFTNTINFEHTVFLTESLIDYLLSANNFEIVEKSYFSDHSIFYSTRKSSKVEPQPIPKCYEEHKSMYLSFLTFYRDEIVRLNALLVATHKPVYLFGGHIFSQFLVYMGLDTQKVVGIIDNSEIKQTKRLYGTALTIGHPSVISEQPEVAVIVKAGQYQEEVVAQLKQLNPLVEIWE